MVKADVRRDYYADLGVSPNAEPDEIKKQFRKLALKYHPDRNPGREVDFISKFQAIQAAHEILCEPQQRLRYDTDRLRAGYGRLYDPPPQRANTSRKAPPPTTAATGASFARTSTKPQYTKPEYPSFPSAGAQRYASYARGAPWQKPQDGAQTRADAYRGFQEMKGGGHGASAWAQFDPRTGQSTAGANYNNNNNSSSSSKARTRFPPPPTGQSTRTKSAYEYFKNAAKMPTPEQSKKKQGFAPRGAGGDEPMARNTSAYTSTPRKSDRSSNFFEFAPSSPPTARRASVSASADPPLHRNGDIPAPERERDSSRYAATGGEKTYLSSPSSRRPGLGRSNSVRDPPNPSVPKPAERHRSASPKYDRSQQQSSSSSASSSGLSDSDSDSDIETDSGSEERPKAVPKSRLHPNQKFSDFHIRQEWNFRSGTIFDPAAFSHTTTTSNRRRSQAYGDSQNSRDPFNPYDRVFLTFSQNQAHLDPFRFTGTGYSFEADSSSPNSNGNSNGYKTAKTAAGANRGVPQYGATGFRSSNTSPDFVRGMISGLDFFGSNTRPEWQGPPSWPQSESFVQGKFAADNWAKYFNNQSWAVPTMNTNGDSTKQQANAGATRGPRKQSRPTATKVRSGPQQPSVSTEADEEKAGINGNVNGTGVEPTTAKDTSDDVEAMDLDEDAPAAAPVNETSKPSNTNNNTRIPSQGRSVSRTKSEPYLNGKETTSTKKESLFDLKNLNVTPLTNTNNEGISDLKDITDTLPFQSRPNKQKTSQAVRPRELNCPNPPKRPRIPSLQPVSAGSQQLVLSRVAWNRYVAEMNTYMREWKDFNRRILRHFNARQEAIDTGLAPGWISTVGDSARLRLNPGDNDDAEDGVASSAPNGDHENENSAVEDLIPGSGKGGYRAYLRGLEEDVKVRKHWEVACELHRESILELGRVREWILNGGKVL